MTTSVTRGVPIAGDGEGTFVSVGNATQPFRRLLDAVSKIALSLPQPVVVQAGHSRAGAANCQEEAFLEPQAYLALVSRSRLLVLHGGAGSVIHALAAGKVPVVVPRQARFREHVDDHQVEFCRALSQQDRIVLVEDVERLAEACREALRRQASVPASGRAPRLLALVAADLASSGAARD